MSIRDGHNHILHFALVSIVTGGYHFLKNFLINGVFPVTFDSRAEHGKKYDGSARSSFLQCLQI